ncbi:hypothetical protein WA026_023461 [Henosepilachna vigintioctopunctata]|uniref:Uncharacterized protein n=1 Tax=Henosepilachna vigintioctopunctata TaxID=420089 RepID=A0AAW1VH96_9CUCU
MALSVRHSNQTVTLVLAHKRHLSANLWVRNAGIHPQLCTQIMDAMQFLIEQDGVEGYIACDKAKKSAKLIKQHKSYSTLPARSSGIYDEAPSPKKPEVAPRKSLDAITLPPIPTPSIQVAEKNR